MLWALFFVTVAGTAYAIYRLFGGPPPKLRHHHRR